MLEMDERSGIREEEDLECFIEQSYFKIVDFIFKTKL